MDAPSNTLLAMLLLAGAAAQAAKPEADPARHVRANVDHPAVVVARLAAAQSRLDPNTFIVQPPAMVSWTVQPEPKALALASEPGMPGR